MPPVDPMPQFDAQDMILMLMEQRSFNDFDGEHVSAQLRAHRDLWSAVWFGPCSEDDVGILLRELSGGRGYWADTLIVAVTHGKEKDFLLFANGLGADELDELTGFGFGTNRPTWTAYRLWWD